MSNNQNNHRTLDLTHRPRRLRQNETIRNLVGETNLDPQNLIYPIFITEGQGQKIPFKTLPGQHRWSIDELVKVVPRWMELGIKSLALFPQIPDKHKSPTATEALNPKGFLPNAIKELKNKFPDLVLISDVALDPYSSDGHDGIVRNGKIVNDESVSVLSEMAAMHAAAGVDIVAPSDMMDGRVGSIREALDETGFQDTAILAYSAKYASSFYGPFREALDSAPRSGDKKTYQMDFRNRDEALREVELDLGEGADIVMVKPALSYLDVIYQTKQVFKVPVAAYNVSGEYAMVKAAGAAGMGDETKMMVEILTSIKRAGADMILTYHAVEMAELLSKK
ncbi:MAG: porphobilinogen synthase [Bdellovibrionota bacterium]